MKKEEWIEQLQNRMADHQESVPEGLWEKIESALPPAEPQKARVATWRRWAAAAAVAGLLLGGAGYYYNKGGKADEETLLTTTAKSNGLLTGHGADAQPQGSQVALSQVPGSLKPHQTGGISIKTQSPHSGEESRADQIALAQLTETVEPHAAETMGTLETTATESDKATAGKNETATSGSDKAAHEQKDAEKTATATDHRKLLTGNGDLASHSAQPVEQKRASKEARWSAGLLAANVIQSNMPTRSSTQPVMMSAAKAYNLGVSNAVYTSAMNSGQRDAFHLPGYEEHTEHHQPMSYGLSFRYRLNNRWAIESGLVYSQVTSDFTKQMMNNKLTDHQTLHYVGLPLAVDYMVWGNRLLTTYLQVGGQMDKNVKASLESEGTKLEMDKDRLQWSAHGAAGLQLNVTPVLGVYVEPGVSYYFDNHSDVENIFKDKKLNFHFQFGLRLDIK